MTGGDGTPRWSPRRSIALRIGVLAEVVLLLWCAGRVCSNRYLWSQYLLWIPTQAALLAAVAAALTAGRRRRGRAIAFGTVFIIVLGRFALFEHALLHGPGEASAGCLTVAHWEAGGAYASGDVPEVAEILDALDADVVVLTNLNYSWSIDEAAEARGYTRARRRAGYGVVVDVLTRGAATVDGQDHLGVQRAAAWRITTELASTPVTIDVVDMPADPRDARYHFAERVLRKLDGNEPNVVVGDCNMTRGSSALHHAFPHHHHAYDDGGGGYAATFRREFALYHIDHVLLDDTLLADRYELIDLGVGRHLAQRAWIRRAATP